MKVSIIWECLMLLSAYAFCTVNNSQLASLAFCTSDSVDFHTSDDDPDSGAIAPSMACLGNRNFRRRVFDLSFLDDDCKLGGKISCLGEKKMGKKKVTFNFKSVSRESQSLSASDKSVDSNDTKEIKHGKSIKGILKTPSGTSVQSNK